VSLFDFSEERIDIPQRHSFDPQRNINSLSDNELLALCGLPQHILQAIVEFRAQKGSSIRVLHWMQSWFIALTWPLDS
jgi:hypothetical protein